MADLLTRVQRELEERIAALRPLAEEARQLEEALAALNGTPPAERAEEPAAEQSPRSVRSRVSREQADDRRRQALAIITENPGTTASNLALLLDTSTGTMHSLLKRLEAEGEIEKAEKGYARPKPKGG